MATEQVRVVVDGRALTDASAFRGIGSYLRAVLGGLAGLSDFEVTVLARRTAAVPSGAQRRAVLRLAPGRWQDREHHALLPLDLARTPGDVVLSPALDPPAWCARPWVQTLHDVLPLEGRSPAEIRRFHRHAARYRRAAALITVSQWTADVAIAELGVDSRRLHVVPHGVSDRFRPSPPADRRPYVLFVGEYDPRKRHDVAFAAIGALADAGHPHELLVPGRQVPWHAEAMAALHAGSPRPERIQLLGHVSADELLQLYQGATALLVTSSAEGFGFPALEAMACGTPVVAYANSATREIVGDAGLLVPDGDFAGLTSALSKLASEPGLRSELSARGVERARLFTWESSVEGHAHVLREASKV